MYRSYSATMVSLILSDRFAAFSASLVLSCPVRISFNAILFALGAKWLSALLTAETQCLMCASCFNGDPSRLALMAAFSYY